VPGAWVALAATIGAVALAGCGGSGPGAETSPLAADQAPVPVPAAAATNGAAARRQSRGGAHRRDRATVHHKRGTVAHHASPPPVRAHGSTSAFSAVAIGDPQAIDHLAASVDTSSPGTSAAGTSSAALSTGRLVAAADAICSSYRHTVRTTGSTATTLVAQQNELSTLVGETADALKRLGALSPPATESALLGRYVAATRASVADFVKAQTRSRSTSEAIGNAVAQQDLQYAQKSATAA